MKKKGQNVVGQEGVKVMKGEEKSAHGGERGGL